MRTQQPMGFEDSFTSRFILALGAVNRYHSQTLRERKLQQQPFGRLAQRESIAFTRRGSQVQIL